MDIALFLDFDGTLTEIAPRPDAVQVEPGLVEDLERLRARLDGALAIVTGRPVTVIDGFLTPSRLDAAGLHGVERRVGGAITARWRITRICAGRSRVSRPRPRRWRGS